MSQIPSALPKTEIDEKHYVNDATLELLQNRMEREIKKSFFTWTGIPLGLAGIAAILYALFIWLPKALDDHVAKNADVQQKLAKMVSAFLDDTNGAAMIQRLTVEHLNDPRGGKPVVEGQARAAASAHLTTGSGKELLRTLVAKAVAESVKTNVAQYFASPNAIEQLRTLVGDQMKSNYVREIVKQAIQTNVQAKIQTQQSKAVVQVKRVGDDSFFEKGDIRMLRSFLQGTEAKKLRTDKNRNLFLTFKVGHGYYVPQVAAEYLKELKGFFGEQFKYCLVTDANERMLALVPVEVFAEVVNAPARHETFRTVFNQSSSDSTAQSVAALFGNNAAVSANAKIYETLTSKIWKSADWNGEEHPVIGAKHEFLGITTRAILLDAFVASL